MTALLIGSFAVALLVGFPVAVAMGGSGLLALLAWEDLSPLVLPQRLWGGIASFPLLAVPFFVLASELMTEGGITRALLRLANDLVGHIRGGLGHVNVLSSVFFSGISGSALADAAGPGAIEMRMMREAGYDPEYAAALSAASATIGPIIPPSIIMVIYAVTDSRVTVAGLFLAGVVPGLLLGVALSAANHWIAVRRGWRFRSRRPGLREVAGSFWKALPALMMPVLIVGGILAGVFTPTEAAATAVVYALAVGLFVTRTLSWGKIPGIFVRSAVVTSAVLLIVSMASMFAWMLTILQVPQELAAWVAGFASSRAAVLVLITLFVLACGLFIDTLPAVIILVPVLAPIAQRYGIDPLHFAMTVVLNLTVGMITPPVGAVLFVTSSVGNVRMERLVRAIAPLLAAELVVLALVVAFPALSVAVPRLFGFSR
jgi:tripartite ATP-independent transporter DctM subunit